jgi:indolepyruvate ferredoxin oxidoreductase beta subunit
VLKGYGDTQVRGRLNYARLWATHVTPALGGALDSEHAASGLRDALKTTLADPEGKLNQAHQRAPASREQPVFWAARPTRDKPITPAA